MAKPTTWRSILFFIGISALAIAIGLQNFFPSVPFIRELMGAGILMTLAGVIIVTTGVKF